MVAFRKAFPVLAIVGFLLGTATNASAQAGAGPLVCDTSAGVPPLVRAEGHTELVGDIILECRGGNSATPFTANFQLFLNTNVTSRLSTAGTLSEALLLVDQAGNGTTPFCVSPATAQNSTGFNFGSGAFDPAAAPTCNPSGASTTFQQGTYTAFRAQPATAANGAANAAVVWPGVPILPPGTTGVRRFRITNVRANAAAVPASASLVPSQIFAFLSISASQSLAVNNPQQAVAFVLPGLQFDVTACNGGTLGSAGNFSQCLAQNGNPGQLGLRFREGFQTAFKTRVQTGQDPSAPGVVYNSESGFVRGADTTLNGGFSTSLGLADSGTRVAARFTGVPEGVSIFVSNVSLSTPTTGTNTNVGSSSAQAVLVSAAGSTGSGGILGANPGAVPFVSCATDASNIGYTEVVLTGSGNARAGVAVWEVVASDPALLETLFFAMSVRYERNLPNNLPGLGTSSVTGSFAPFFAANSNAGTASSSLPIPRFIDNARPVTDFTINQCVTNLLFPFVTNAAGFDTGIAIVNTSRDPFGSAAGRVQEGTCTLNYYGSTPGGPAPPAFTTTAPVTAGGNLTFTLMGGGGLGVPAQPGFQGYIIAQCRFQYAHGFAFITDGPIGTARVAEGYLALVMDTPATSRTGSTAESLGN